MFWCRAELAGSIKPQQSACFCLNMASALRDSSTAEDWSLSQKEGKICINEQAQVQDQMHLLIKPRLDPHRTIVALLRSAHTLVKVSAAHAQLGVASFRARR